MDRRSNCRGEADSTADAGDPFKTIVEHFQNIIGPLIHEKITRHPGANTQETVSAILPPGFHQYLFLISLVKQTTEKQL